MASLAGRLLRPGLRSTYRYQPVKAWHASPLRTLITTTSPGQAPDFAFAFDIDGVLVRSSKAIPKAGETLSFLQENKIPFVLLTNGGGKTEAQRVDQLSEILDVRLDESIICQSHTPFKGLLDELQDKTILVVGGTGRGCADVARSYGFKNVVTPGDILVSHPDVWPFSHVFMDYYNSFAQPLPRPIDASNPEQSLKIDAILVFNDPRDWALDSTIMLDLLLSSQGILGTLSKKNGDTNAKNHGYLQDGQPRIYYSNPDLWWAAAHPLPRLGQGGFQQAFAGLWTAASKGAMLDDHVTMIGKPHNATYVFAENVLRDHRQQMVGEEAAKNSLKRVFMIGDNPLSDIMGANNYQSKYSPWTSILVKTGVYDGGEPSVKPKHIANNVNEAVNWALKQVGWDR